MQAHDAVAEVAEHALDLVITTLVQGQAGGAGVEDFQLGGEGGEVLEGEVQPLGEGLDVLGLDGLLGFHVVDLGLLAAGQGEPA
ncbi:hypothetical protein D9M69_382100 [compost metagenome]